MVFDVDRHAFVVRVETGAFGNSPALHRSFQFQPEVVVQTRCPVLLDNKRQNLGSTLDGCLATGNAAWLRCYREITFGPVSFKRVIICHSIEFALYRPAL